MTFARTYSTQQPNRDEIDASTGTLVIEFGTNWCGHCQAAQPLIEEAITRYPDVHHVKVEDGSGRALGRSFRVKLWPTLICLKDGVETGRVVRPANVSEVRQALESAL